MFIGLDIGGSKMLGGAFVKNKLIRTKKLKTPTASTADAITALIITLIKDLSENAPIKGIGIGIPGSIDRSTGTIGVSPNLPFKNFNLKTALAKEFSCPIAIDNDVNVGLLGEHWAGAAKPYKNVVGIFVGTGIGGALILNGALHHGKHQIAGEIGHMKLKLDGPLCNCGEHGCLEALASKTGIQKMLELKGFKFDGVVKSSWIRDQLAKNNKDVKLALRVATQALGEGIGSLANLIDPEAFILGGGLIEALGANWLRRIKTCVKKRALVMPVIKASALADHALLYGAVRLVSPLVNAKNR